MPDRPIVDTDLEYSGVNVLLASRMGESKEREKVPGQNSSDSSRSITDINIKSIIVATLVFIILVSWYECLRLAIKKMYTKEDKNDDDSRPLPYYVYTFIGTIIGVIAIIFCMRGI